MSRMYSTLASSTANAVTRLTANEAAVGRQVCGLVVLSAILAICGKSRQATAAGPEWEMQNPMPHSPWLVSVWAGASNSVFAVGEAGTVLHYDGANWSEMASGTPVCLNGVWGTGPNDVFAVGDGVGWFQMTIIHYDGSGWTDMSCLLSGDNLYSVWGSGPEDVLAVGRNSVVHYDGVSWSEMYTPMILNLYALWGCGPSDVFAVGWDDGGVVLHWNGSQWAESWTPTDCALYGVWGTGPNDVFAVGGDYAMPVRGVVLHYDGTSWSEVAEATDILEGVWGSGLPVRRDAALPDPRS